MHESTRQHKNIIQNMKNVNQGINNKYWQ